MSEPEIKAAVFKILRKIAPEADYRKLGTLRELTHYLSDRLK